MKYQTPTQFTWRSTYYGTLTDHSVTYEHMARDTAAWGPDAAAPGLLLGKKMFDASFDYFVLSQN